MVHVLIKTSFFSKRSQTADHSINQKISREQANLARKIYLNELLRRIDTSDRLAETSKRSQVVPVKSSSPVVGGKSRSKNKRRKGKGRKNRKGRKRIGKRGRKNGRRRTRAVANSIVHLLESDQGEAILHAIAKTIEDDYEYSDNVEDLEDFVKTTARKCKCRKGRKSKD